MSILKAGQRFLAPYQLSDIHTAADIQEFGAIGEGQGFELTRLRLAIKSYASKTKEGCGLRQGFDPKKSQRQSGSRWALFKDKKWLCDAIAVDSRM